MHVWNDHNEISLIYANSKIKILKIKKCIYMTSNTLLGIEATKNSRE
jgi:hypothetical protein